MSHNIIDDKTGKVYTADIEFDDSLGFSVIDQAKKDLNASGMGSGLVNTGSFMDPQWLVMFLLVVLIGVAGWYFNDKRSKQQKEQAGSDIESILRLSSQNLPPYTRGRFWPDRGSVMSWHLGRNVESKNIFGCLKIRFEGVGYEIFGGRLWKNRTRGVGYEILVVDFQKFWLGGSVMRFLWFGFEKFWLWGVC